MDIAKISQTGCYAVIFNSVLKENTTGYEETAHRMFELAQQQTGFLGFESARNEIGITISYWEDLQSIKKWKENGEHMLAQKMGKQKWYESYALRICKIEKQYYFNLKD